MSLTAAMLIGRSGLTASQAGIQVAANNIANASTPGYSRQVMYLEPQRGVSLGSAGTIGRGVSILDVRRQVSEALQSRLWSSVSDEASAGVRADTLGTLESALNELSGYDLTTEMSDFFGAWSEAANLTQSEGVVVQQGQRMAGFIQRLRGDLVRVRTQIEEQLDGLVARANALLDRVAELNTDIAANERGKPNANELRDQRDSAITELSGLLDVTVVEQTDGRYDVLVGSMPVVLGANNRGIEVRQDPNAALESVVGIADGGAELELTSGVIGGLIASRDAGIDETVDALDRIAGQLIYQVNRLHSTGTRARGLTSIAGTLAMPAGDRTRALNDPANQTLAGLPFAPENGGFLVHVRHVPTGQLRTVRIDVDLDGLNTDGSSGYDDDTSADDIRAALDGVTNLSASFTGDGRLRIEADPGFEFSFADDTSGALATLGVNSFFTGTEAADIAVRTDLTENPLLLSTGRLVDGVFVQNGTALAIADAQGVAIDALGGVSLREAWASRVQQIANETDEAQDRLAATGLVRQSLEAQRGAVSGVSIDEESINLVSYQKQYEGSARVISVASELLDTLLSIV